MQYFESDKCLKYNHNNHNPTGVVLYGMVRKIISTLICIHNKNNNIYKKVKQYLDPAYEASWLPKVANLPLPVSSRQWRR